MKLNFNNFTHRVKHQVTEISTRLLLLMVKCMFLVVEEALTDLSIQRGKHITMTCIYLILKHSTGPRSLVLMRQLEGGV